MRIEIHPESDDDVQQIRGWAAMGMPSGRVEPMYQSVVLACTKWVDEHPDLFSLKPGSIIRVPSGVQYVVQSDGKWLRLPAMQGQSLTFIDPKGAEWSDAEWSDATIEWSAS